MADKEPASDNAGGERVAETLMVARPFYRLTLGTFVLLALIALVWGLFGSVPNRIEGFGEVVTQEGLYSLSAPATGQVGSMHVRYGEHVTKGKLLMRLEQPDLLDQVAATTIQVETVKAELDILRSGDSSSAELRKQLQGLELKRLQAQLDEAQTQISFLEDQLSKQQKLFAEGVIIRATLAETQDSLARQRVTRDQTREGIKSLNLDNQQWLIQKDMNEQVKANQLINLQKQLDNLHLQLKRNSEVHADRDGRVVEVNAARGALVQRGEALLVLEDEGAARSYQFDLYVPYSADDPIAVGMRVDVELLAVDHDLYGWLIGEVKEINDYVATQAELHDNLQNDALVSKVSTNGPVFRIVVSLRKDDATKSGFAWTDGKGPPFAIHVGSLGNAYVHVQDKAPIDYLIPIFKKYFD
ncbi:NHLP bacteriocin system secretion protein [Dokdonella sp.]|uniref:NHLP bacteriocin system secretion protein n=1 Tax=Dokdonella sp. TaxID=2291710 RepID=UPI0025C248BA|nr:NHLP bacteriocin system secretion protein [Dokdonella sp.]MBX3688618.1 NHLP bacteriocin system secretion protein [Dokdonella sp.]